MDEIDEILVEDDRSKHPEGTVFYSHSKLSNQATCPARNFFRTIEDEIKDGLEPAYPLVYGSAAHLGFEKALINGENPHTVADLYIQENLLDNFPANKLDAKAVQEKRAHMHWCIDRFEENFYDNLMRIIKEPASQIEVKLQAPFRKGLFTGVVDVLFPEYGIFSDWKTGAKPPRLDRLYVDRQQAIYFYLGLATGVVPQPREFNYVYLVGKNERRIKAEYKSGPRKGETYWKDDPDNPPSEWKYSWKVPFIQKRVESVFTEKIIPLAKAYEEGIVYKEQSDFNCNTCQYRTVCPEYSLPSKEDFTLPRIITNATDQTN